MQKGQAFSAGVKVRETRSAITNAIIKEMRAGTEPTISSIAAVVGKVYNTVKKHFFAAYVAAMASISIQALVKGVNPPSGQTRPTLRVLLTANMPSDLPDSWIPESGDPVLSDHFRQKSLILARQRRRKTGSMPSAESLRVPGRNVLNFLHAGQVTVYRRSAACNPPARARSQPTCCRHHAVSGGRVS